MSWGEVLKINSDMTKPLNTLMSEVIASKSAVKSIQRGRSLAQPSSDGSTIQNVGLAVASIIPSKCIVLIDNTMGQDPSGTIINAYLSGMTSSSITFYPHYWQGNNNPISKYFYWQLIEFY